jgi:hypothetical protein
VVPTSFRHNAELGTIDVGGFGDAFIRIHPDKINSFGID